jgi:hypothetical protein
VSRTILKSEVDPCTVIDDGPDFVTVKITRAMIDFLLCHVCRDLNKYIMS